MYRVSFQGSIDEPWRLMDPIRVGPVPTGGAEPQYVTVERDGTPFARVDAYAAWRGPFTELIVWQRFVVLGWDEVVHLIDPAIRETRGIPCDGYFGHLYALDDRLLIATASELICIDRGGEMAWRRANVGIDGVVVHRINDGIVIGAGEWDPPGGWRPFRLLLATGESTAL